MAFLGLALFAGKAYSAEPFSLSVDACRAYTYSIHTLNDGQLCSFTKLTTVEIGNLASIVNKFKTAYKYFTKDNIRWSQFSSTPKIVIISDSQMNDVSYFGYSDAKVDARFFITQKLIYIRLDAISINSPDLPHELAHLANSEMNVLDERRDELLAYSFEDVFLNK